MPIFIFTSLTCHRFLIAAITASSKGLCDAFCTNQLYAKVGGISVTELNSLEREFLSAVDWRLVVSRLLFQDDSCPSNVHPVHPTSLPFHPPSVWLICLFFSLQNLVLTVSTYPCQCTRDGLNEYYTNLVRTNSTGRYLLRGDNSQCGSDSDRDVDSGQSRDPSPEISMSPTHRRSIEASMILVDSVSHVPPEGIPRATLEQNMAFAALQQSQYQSQAPPSQQPN